MALTATRSFSRRRRWATRLGRLVSAGLIAYIFLVANVIVFCHKMRIDLTEERVHALSPETIAMLGLVQAPVDVIAQFYLPSGGPTFQHHRPRFRVVERARDLLRQFAYHQPLVRIVAEVDCVSDPDRWKRVCQENGLETVPDSRIVISIGDGSGVKQIVTPDDLAVFDMAASRNGEPATIKEFRGERALASACSRLLHRDRKVVYFTQDKGEIPLADRKEISGELRALTRDLESLGFEAAPLLLSTARRVPDDCELLIIAGPEQDFSGPDLEALDEYLAADGRLLVTLGTRSTALGSLLGKWGAGIGPARVRMKRTRPGSLLETDSVLVEAFNNLHPVTRPFASSSSRVGVQLEGPRLLKAGLGSGGFEAERLLSTKESSVDEKFFLAGAGGDPAESPGGDARNFVVAVAVSQRHLERPPAGWLPRRTRMVVVGASNFLRDPPALGHYQSWVHRDLVLNSVRWLTEREDEIALGGQEILAASVDMEKAGATLGWIAVAIYPGIFLSLGCLVYYARRT